MIEYDGILAKLKRPDVPALREAYRSNGGGFNECRYSPTCISRLMNLNLLQGKPNQFRGNPKQFVFLVVLTEQGKQFIEEYNKRNAKS